MDIFDNPDRIKLAFGIPFFNMDFNELMLTVGEKAGIKDKSMIFAPSFPWMLDYAKHPDFCPFTADFILPADSSLLAIAEKAGIKLKMPIEYFEFPEQIARICAHYGFSMLHVSETALKTDILVRDGFVPLSWDLFTHFKTAGELDELDAQSIVASANDLQPDIVLISAPPESIGRHLADIYNELNGGMLICIPQDLDKNKFTDKMENILTPLLLLRDEINFLEDLSRKRTLSMGSSVNYTETCIPPRIEIIGVLDEDLAPELLRAGMRMLKRNFSPALDLSETSGATLTGLETLCFLSRKFREQGKNITISNISDNFTNIIHKTGATVIFNDFPGIINDL
ncbi:STAS domain-containing protein [Maridesulfovibrio sp.]|uniref:STAS domain-containing protein n=1 Tax=Maridesulfovibrio sp. TaxID=2795000 RepID=UPI0029CAA14A|nr:STAS domain-containing protein [Maridesulfovibrio sp.]